MKNNFIAAFLCLPLVFVSCSQDSIFAQISDEPPQKKQMISGSLTNIVIAKEKEGEDADAKSYIYTAGISSRRIHRYGEDEENNGVWTTFDTPNAERIIALASDGENLYALSGDDVMSANLHKRTVDTKWESIGKGDASPADGGEFSLQSIFCAGDTLFVGGRRGQEFDIFYLNDNNSLESATGNTRFTYNPPFSEMGQLNGAAKLGSGPGAQYFLAAGTEGVFIWTQGGALNPVPGSTGNITGIQNINGEIIALSWSGSVYNVTDNKFETIATTGLYFTGGMGIWSEYDNDGNGREKLLLIGIHTSGNYNKGYREILLEDFSGKTLDEPLIPAIPGTSGISSVKTGDKNRYDAVMARHSVSNIIQVPPEVESPKPNTEPVIFATAVRGLHGFREGIWNFE